MISNVSRLAYQIGEKVFHLYAEQNSTTAELKEVATQIIGHMAEIEKHVAESAAQKEDVKEVEVEVVD